nr:hypothetical protein BaRGS_028790 [Batillaria attramentaria]
MCRLLSFPLPTLKKKIKSVARELFVLLKNYASAGAAKGDNQELVFTCFKAVTVLVREVKYYKLSAEHLQVLLTFCEEDIHDHTRQSTAFSVLKAILQRTLNVPELHELMSTMESMSITAEAQHLRLQCRQVDVRTRDSLFSITFKWMSDKKSKEASEEQEYDHWLFNLMTLLSKILRSTDILQQARWREDIGHILEHVREHLLYPHSWVRLVCCQIFGQVFASTKQDGHEIPPFLAENTQTKMKKLVQQMCSQLQSPLLDDDLASQVVKNLVFLAKLFHLTDQEGQFSLGWLARKLTKEANFEKIHNTKVTVRREAEDNSHDDTLKTLAQEVIELLKKKVGVEEFSAVYTNTQQVRQQRKEARKVKRAVDAVKTPEVAARKRMKKTVAKQEAKKRKIDQKKQRVKKSKLSIYQHSQ